MVEYVKKNRNSLENLPYHRMKHLLTTYGVITSDEKRVMDHYYSGQMFTVINKIIPNLLNNQPKIFKSFLEVMEESDDSLLEDTAKRLGMYISELMVLLCISLYIVVIHYVTIWQVTYSRNQRMLPDGS